MRTTRRVSTLIATIPIAAILWLASGWAFQSNENEPPGLVKKDRFDLDIRSAGRQFTEEVASRGNVVTADEISPVPGGDVVPQIQFRGANVQVNDASLDNIQTFPNFRPFVGYTQSETSIAAFGRNIVAAYNSSANQPLTLISPILPAWRRKCPLMPTRNRTEASNTVMRT